MLLTWLKIIGIIIFILSDGIPKDKTIFISPVKIPLLLSANFGELRPDHYHSGIDIKTQGVTGKEVVASADGYVSRITVSPAGFGKAVYIRHPSGFTTVYGHLDKFIPEIEEYVKEQQYEKKSFLLTIYPPREKFNFRQGNIIAYSGNSGSSGGPHLHYEIRRSDSEMPVNPLHFEFGTGDNIEPVIEKLVIYPINTHSEINNQRSIKKINVSGGNGNYYIPADNEIKICGIAGFGIKSFDLLNDSYNKCSVYSIELEIDSIKRFRYIMDSFSFTESRYINSHIDYATYQEENYFVERVFKLPNDKLSAYKEVINRGLFNFNDDKLHHVSITVTDIHKNKSVLSFKVRSVPPSPGRSSGKNLKELQVMPYNKSNKFEAEDISLAIPYGALYDTLFFDYSRSDGSPGMLSDIHHVHNNLTPMHKSARLLIKPSKIPAGKDSKMFIAYSGADRQRIAQASTWENGFMAADVMSLGSYYIDIDTIAPVISPSGFASGAVFTGKKTLKIKITDDFSGIRSYEPEIDGKWALFEYDQKNSLLTYEFDEKRIEKGNKHSLFLRVTDSKDNSATYKCSFTW
jgi:hypothetical protein